MSAPDTLIGMTAGAQAESDGYTFLVVTTPYVVMPWLQKKMPYETKDLQPVIWMTSSPFVLVVPPTLPVKNVQELVALAKARPNELNMASAGPTTGPHLAGELFRLSADIKVQHVAYRGGPQAETAILRGEATFLFDTPSGALPHVEAGAMRGLAVTSLKRMDNAPRHSDGGGIRHPRIRGRQLERPCRAGRRAESHRQHGWKQRSQRRWPSRTSRNVSAMLASRQWRRRPRRSPI